MTGRTPTPLNRRIAALSAVLAVSACGSSQIDPAGATTQTAEAPPSAAAPAQQPAATGYQLPPGAPPLAPDLLAIGSQDARDDLYCSAVIYEANPDVSDALAPVDEALLRKAQMLGFIVGESGINRLIAEGAAHATHARAIADAYAAQIEKDVRAGTTRISLEDCNQRAQAVPVPQ